MIGQAIGGDVRALSRLLSVVEEGGPDGHRALKSLYPRVGEAHLVGVTGAPGAGKSSLIARLVREIRKGSVSRKIAVIAVDPTSPLSRGALLGDRLRLHELDADEPAGVGGRVAGADSSGVRAEGDPGAVPGAAGAGAAVGGLSGIFFRSQGTRGHRGGLARTTGDLAAVFDACGYDLIILETVGSGQAEYAVRAHCDTLILVATPGMGDEIQALKAGVLELADLIVVNKADRPGAGKAAGELKEALGLGREKPTPEAPVWTPPILTLSALTGEGLPALAGALASHRRFLEQAVGLDELRLKRAAAAVGELATALILERLARDTAGAGGGGDLLETLARRVIAGEIDLLEAADFMVEKLFRISNV
ncbi:MAG: hypothetical protein HYY09_00750 [Firmicutes bacterium]|nr:hypothetical protein [Bacillota bacterium]